MQAHYGYRNFIDACFKIWNEQRHKTLINCLKNFYSGAFYYTLAYTALIALEFGIHDIMIELINEKDWLKFLRKKTENGHNDWHSELAASVVAGSVGGFLTNGLEIVAVNK